MIPLLKNHALRGFFLFFFTIATFRWFYRWIRKDQTFFKTDETSQTPQTFYDKTQGLTTAIYLSKAVYILYTLTYLSFGSMLGSLIGCIVLYVVVLFLLSSLFKQPLSAASGGGSVVVDDSRFNQLTKRYELMAEEYIKRKNYSKAAYIYLKLLKDSNKAAETLRTGKQFQNAANIYLKFCSNKLKAAECFEEAKLYTKAIDLYKELNNNEKVGDLYMEIKDRANAEKYYKIVIDNYVTSNQFVKAAILYRTKLQDFNSAQDLLLQGWRQNKDAFNCMNNYFANIQNVEKLGTAIATIYEKEVNKANQETFLRVLKKEYEKHPPLQASVKQMAYEIIVDAIPRNKEIASELMFFNDKNEHLQKDIFRYKLSVKK
jgi:hypothetical protein